MEIKECFPGNKSGKALIKIIAEDYQEFFSEL